MTATAGALKIAVADDHALVLHGLRALLESVGVEVAIAAPGGAQLLDALRRQAVDIVVCDIRMPGCSGIEVTRALRDRGDLTPVLLLTTFDEPALLRTAVAAGAQGYMLKDASPEALHQALTRIARGETLLAPMSLADIAAPSMPDDGGRARATPRELSILRLIAGGYSNKEIGRTLNISEGTVKNHVTDILQKLDARDRTHAVLKAIAARLV